MADVGNLYVIAAPSGAGKTSLVQALTENLPQLAVSISHTTRPKRPSEIDGVNYHFINKETFLAKVAHGDFLEYATIFDHLYGTSKTAVEETLAQGIDVILEIDWQGHQQIKGLFPSATSIFILPPSFTTLKDRLIARDQDSKAVIDERLKDVRTTITHLPEFDYVVINDIFAHSLADLTAIIQAGRLTQRRQMAKYRHIINELGMI